MRKTRFAQEQIALASRQAEVGTPAVDRFPVSLDRGLGG